MRRACATIIRRGSPWEGPMSSEARFRIEAKERVAALWIDNPPRNLLSLSMISELPGLVEAIEKDDTIRAVVVSGAGPAHFSAGVDMDEWSRLAPKEAQEAIRRGQDALWALEHLTKPTIAALAGVVRGAGTELALACDLRIVDDLSAPDQAFEQASALADVFARKPRASVKAVKRVLTEGDEKPYRNRFLLESQHAVQLLWSDDYRAAMERLRERRPK